MRLLYVCMWTQSYACISAGNVHPHKLFLTKYEWVAKRGLLNIYQIKSSQISFGETNILYKKSCSLRVIMRKTKSMNSTLQLSDETNFMSKFWCYRKPIRTKSILSHSDDGTFKALQKYFECCKNSKKMMIK